MRKIILLVGIFTILMNSQAKARYYYEEDYYNNIEHPRYEERVEYVNPRDYDIAKTQQRDNDYIRKNTYSRSNYQKINTKERVLRNRDNYHQYKYYEEYKEPSNIRPYIGIDVATSKIDFGTDEWVVYDSYEYHDDKNESMSFVLGAKLNNNFGLEAFYQISNESEKNYYWDEDAYETDVLSYTAFGMDAIAYMPVTQELELLAALGLAQYNFETSYKDTIVGEGTEKGEEKDFDSLGIRIGIGAQYNITDRLALRTMARYIKMNDDEYIKNLTEISLGLRYMF